MIHVFLRVPRLPIRSSSAINQMFSRVIAVGNVYSAAIVQEICDDKASETSGTKLRLREYAIVRADGPICKNLDTVFAEMLVLPQHSGISEALPQAIQQ